MKPLTRIGVTGHRKLAEVKKLVPAVDRALEAVVTRFPAERFEIISALAEGADCLVARCARDTGLGVPFELVVPLPLPRREYARDAAGRGSREEFEALIAGAARVITLGEAGTSPDAGYRAVADFILAQADVLIAIWDGKDPTNDVGTAAVACRARASGIPLAWVHAGNRRPDRRLEPSTLGSEHGLLTFERF